MRRENTVLYFEYRCGLGFVLLHRIRAVVLRVIAAWCDVMGADVVQLRPRCANSMILCSYSCQSFVAR